jgi:predicted translin family RNA/ssDNA-binding protein
MLTDKEISELAQELKDFAEVNNSAMCLKAAQVLAAVHYHYLLEKQEADEQSKIVIELSSKLEKLNSAVETYLSKKDSTGALLLLQESLACC